MERFANAIVVLWGWRRIAVALVAGALSALALAPFNFFPILWITLPVLVWLIDGATPEDGTAIFRRLLPVALALFWGLGAALARAFWGEGWSRILVFALAMSAVEWLLGGIRIDYYFAVDMNTMIALGDTIGGVDFDVEMSYTGHSGAEYHMGMQHLDGVGITDYLRARTNATVDGTDIART